MAKDGRPRAQVPLLRLVLMEVYREAPALTEAARGTLELVIVPTAPTVPPIRTALPTTWHLLWCILTFALTHTAAPLVTPQPACPQARPRPQISSASRAIQSR